VLKGIRLGAEGGAIVPVGETMAFIAQPDEEVPALSPLAGAKIPPAKAQGEVRRAQERIPSPPSTMRAAPATVKRGRVRAAPVVRRVARELGVDLTLVKGTGPGGRIREEDVRAFAEAAAAAPAPQPDEAGAEWLEMTPIQRVTGQRMAESVQRAAQLALTISADMTHALGLRESLMEQVVAETGARLSITAILVKVVGAALRQYPRANVSFEEGRIKVHSQVNIGVAVGTDDGLIVPMIREADRKSLIQITRELKAFQEKAQQMRFSAEELAGGTFTISNLGMYGIDHFSAIINPPQSAILAVGRIIKTPVGMPDDTIALRPMVHLTLTVDHRALDGLQGAEFLAKVKKRLEQPYLLL